MNRGVTLALIASLLALFVVSAAAQGFGHLGDRFGRLGASGKGKGSGSGGACTNRLDFSVSCNSQYIVTGPLR